MSAVGVEQGRGRGAAGALTAQINVAGVGRDHHDAAGLSPRSRVLQIGLCLTALTPVVGEGLGHDQHAWTLFKA